MDYKCSLCSFVCDWEDLCVEHMKKEHVRWRSEGGGGKNYNNNVDNYLLHDRSQRSSQCCCRTIRRIKFLKGRGKSKRNCWFLERNHPIHQTSVDGQSQTAFLKSYCGEVFSSHQK